MTGSVMVGGWRGHLHDGGIQHLNQRSWPTCTDGSLCSTACVSPGENARLESARGDLRMDLREGTIGQEKGDQRMCKRKGTAGTCRTKRRHGSVALPRLVRVVSVNARSLLCDKHPDTAETARTQLTAVQEGDGTERGAHSSDTRNQDRCKARVGGLQTWIAKIKGLKLLWTREFSYRVLVVGIAWHSEKWVIVNAYAPTTAAPLQEFRQFMEVLGEVMQFAKKEGFAVLMGADLNTRLGSEQDGVHIGAAVYDSASGDGKLRAELVVDFLAHFNLAAWSTFMGEPKPTWFSPHETESQIDFLIGDMNKIERLQGVAVEDVEHFQTDHKMLIGELVSNHSPSERMKSSRPRSCRIRGPDHSLAVKLALATRDHDDWEAETDPVIAMKKCCDVIRQVVRDAPGSLQKPSKEWMTAPTWTLIREGAVLRKRMYQTWKSRRRAQLAWAFQGLSRTQSQELGYEWELQSWNAGCACKVAALAWALYRIASRRQAKRVQQEVKIDKKKWLEAKTDQLAHYAVEGTSSDLHRQIKRCLTKVQPNLSATSRAPLKDHLGRYHTTDDAKHLLWQEHRSRLYAGKVCSVQHSFEDCIIDTAPQRSVEVLESDLFTESEVGAAIQHQFNGKTSVDSLPTKEMAVMRGRLVRTWTKGFNAFITAGQAPPAYKGTYLFVVPKKTATTSTSDFRGLQLMLWSAKVFARALFTKCMTMVNISVGQYGLGDSAGVDYPHLMITQLREYARVEQVRMAWLFVDVKTAFDRIVRQLMVRPGHDLSLETLIHMGIERGLACQILHEVAEDTPILWEHRLTPAIQRILSALMQDTWLTLPEAHGGTQMTTNLGTPQGNSLSGLLYILYQQRVLSLLTQFTHEEGYAPVLKAANDNAYAPPFNTDVVLPVNAYHDDALITAVADSVEDLTIAVRKIMRHATKCYHGCNLLLNWTKLKSEVMFLLPRGEMEAFHATVNKNAAMHGWDHPSIEADGTRLRVVRTYLYLGKRIQDTGSTIAHSRERTALAAASTRSFSRVYSSLSIPVKTKANLCNG
eukprot:4854323-Amphidinium_carterae.1